MGAEGIEERALALWAQYDTPAEREKLAPLLSRFKDWTPFYYDHICRVTLAVQELSKDEPYEFRSIAVPGALFHDIGKLAVKPKLIDGSMWPKSERIFKRNYDAVSIHPVYGFHLLKDISWPKAMVARNHHERDPNIYGTFWCARPGYDMHLLREATFRVELADCCDSTRMNGGKREGGNKKAINPDNPEEMKATFERKYFSPDLGFVPEIDANRAVQILYSASNSTLYAAK
jgi:hypothetical protein